MAERKPLLTLTEVTKVYGMGMSEMHALRGINLSIYEGEFVAVMGPSGSGKSTCMNILGCLDTPTSGRYDLLGADVSSLDRDSLAKLRKFFLGFVFQGFNLLNRTTALENVELPLLYQGMSAKDRKEAALKALDMVGLKGWEKHRPNELSGGQQQRVAIARAIVTNPHMILADEPTGNLDTQRSIEVMNLLSKLNKENGITIILVTHESEMAEFADRVIHFRDGLVERFQENSSGGAE